MDGLANTNISNWATDIFSYVNENLTANTIKYYLYENSY